MHSFRGPAEWRQNKRSAPSLLFALAVMLGLCRASTPCDADRGQAAVRRRAGCGEDVELPGQARP